MTFISVGAPILHKDKNLVKHNRIMLSLENSYSIESLLEFDHKVRKQLAQTPTYVCELKYDGVALSLLYKNNEFSKAASRGNGMVGEDLTQKVLKIIPALPKTVPNVTVKNHLQQEIKISDFEVRGEVVMTKSHFDAINESRTKNSLPVFKNSRNLVSGMMNLDLEKLKPSRDSSKSLLDSVHVQEDFYFFFFCFILFLCFLCFLCQNLIFSKKKKS